MIILFYESCWNATEQKASFVDNGIFQANAIEARKYSTKPLQDP